MKICIDPGHGGKDRGATFKGVDEADICLIVAYYLEKILIDLEYDVILTRKLDRYDRSLSERVLFSDMNKADIFISIHVNADPDDDAPGQSQGKGEEIWIYKAGKVLAECMADNVDKIFPDHKFRGIKRAGFYVLKYTNAPAVLIELGFIDNTEELEHLTNPGSYKNIAQLIAKGIHEYTLP